MNEKKLSLPGCQYHTNGRNLHISLLRTPDASTLKSVSSILKTHANASGRLFVDVRALNDMPSPAVNLLQAILKESEMPATSVFFKGPLGFTLASDGNRVLIVRKPGEALPAEAAQRRFEKRKCSCGGKCGDKCCQVTGGPCCSERRHNPKVA